MAKTRNPVKSVRTTLTILQKLQELDGAGITTLAEEIGMSKATVYNHLETLETDGFVVRDDEGYELGLRLFEYGEYLHRQQKIYEVGKKKVDALATETGELANILVEEGGMGYYIHRAKGESALTLDTGVGSRVYLHRTALGKAILAHLPRDRVGEIINEHGLSGSTEQTITTQDELLERLAEIRERGYAVDRQERVSGIRCIAAPVITNDQEVRGAISVAGPVSRMKGERFNEKLPEKVQKTANVVSINLTYS